MEWLNEWTKDQLADYFVAARSLMNDKAGAITDRDWSTLNGRIARPISEMKQLRDSFGQLILAEESTPEQFITAVQNRDVTEFDVHRSTANASKSRRNTKLSARAAEGQATEEAVRSNTRSAKRAAAMKNNRDTHAPTESNYFPSNPAELADSTEDLALVLAFGLGSSAAVPSSSSNLSATSSTSSSNNLNMGNNTNTSMTRSDSLHSLGPGGGGGGGAGPGSGVSSGSAMGGAAGFNVDLGSVMGDVVDPFHHRTSSTSSSSNGLKSQTPIYNAGIPTSMIAPTSSATGQPFLNSTLIGNPIAIPPNGSASASSSSSLSTVGPKKIEPPKFSRLSSGRKIRAKSELEFDPLLSSMLSGPVTQQGRNSLPPVDTAPLLETLNTALRPGKDGEKLRRFVTYEWFYPNIDQDWFQHSDFLSMLHSLHLSRMETGTKAQWNVVRRAFGTPRRMSKTFFQQERDKLEQHRSYVRLLRPRSAAATAAAAASSAASSTPMAAPFSSAQLDASSPRANIGSSSTVEVAQPSYNQPPFAIPPHLEHVSIHSAHANPNDSVDEMWANDAAGDPNALGIRLGMATLGASNAHGVGYISKDKSQVIPKGTRVVVWTKGILSTRPSATAVHSAAARKGRRGAPLTPISAPLPPPTAESAAGPSGGAGVKSSSVDVSTASTIHDEEEYNHDFESEGDLSIDGIIIEEDEGEERSESLAESESAHIKSKSPHNAKSESALSSDSHMDVDGPSTDGATTTNAIAADGTVAVAGASADADASSSANDGSSSTAPSSKQSLISVPSEGRSGIVVLMPSEVVPGRVVKCKKDNTYQVQLAVALENGSHVVTVDDVHIMSCDVNRVSAKRKSAVNTYKVEFNQHEVHSRIHPLANTNQTDVLKTVMLQTPHFFEPDYNLTAVVMLLLDWKEVTLSDMGKALDTLEKSKRTLDAVDAGTKTLAATSVASLRNKYNSSENAVVNLTERLHVINEQLEQYRPNLIERRIMVASSHLAASSVHSARTLANVASTSVPAASWTAADVANAMASKEKSPSPPTSGDDSDSKTVKNGDHENKEPNGEVKDSDESAKEANVKSEGESTSETAMDISSPSESTSANNSGKEAESAKEDSSTAASTAVATGGEEADKEAAKNTILSSPTADGLAALTSLGKSPDRDEIRQLEDESMMTLTEMLISTPTKLRAVGSGPVPIAMPSHSSNPLPSLVPTPRNRSFSGLENDISSLLPANVSDYELEPSPSDSEVIQNRVASSLALIKILGQDGISADVREATVKVALSILAADHHPQNNGLLDSVRTRCDELLHALATSERY